ncbi:hypothetical protein [Streptomyces sp. NPDC088400]|uniref:hypothetical protein n=1 Tax=Streptomyces sp. NPDC088400 TaxID=3365861 RepID=UPI00381AC576
MTGDEAVSIAPQQAKAVDGRLIDELAAAPGPMASDWLARVGCVSNWPSACWSPRSRVS